VGVLVLLGVLLLSDRGRERTVRSIRIGDDSASVATRMGAPAERCPVGTPRPTAEDAVAELRSRTATRWLYGKGDDRSCTPRSGDTEVGFAAGGRVVWVVRTHGTTPITM